MENQTIVPKDYVYNAYVNGPLSSLRDYNRSMIERLNKNADNILIRITLVAVAIFFNLVLGLGSIPALIKYKVQYHPLSSLELEDEIVRQLDYEISSHLPTEVATKKIAKLFITLSLDGVDQDFDVTLDTNQPLKEQIQNVRKQAFASQGNKVNNTVALRWAFYSSHENTIPFKCSFRFVEFQGGNKIKNDYCHHDGNSGATEADKNKNFTGHMKRNISIA